jgi:hypothetical protein
MRGPPRILAALASWRDSAHTAGVPAMLVVLAANLALLNAWPRLGFARDGVEFPCANAPRLLGTGPESWLTEAAATWEPGPPY